MIKSEIDLKKVFGFYDVELISLIDLKSKYRRWKQPKTSGGFRVIVAPPAQLKDFQSQTEKLLAPLVDIRLAKGGIRRQNRTVVVANILKCKKIIKLDIKNCFPSIKGSLIYKKLMTIGFSHKYAKIFTELLTLDNCLPQGSPCSTCLANLVLNDIDKEILEIVPNREKCFRWIDDIFIALDQKITKIETDCLVKNLELIFNSHHFKLKDGIIIVLKEHANDILGLSISKKLNVTKKWYRDFRAQTHRLSVQQKPDEKELNSIKGKLVTLNYVTKRSKKKTRNKKLKQLITGIEKKANS